MSQVAQRISRSTLYIARFTLEATTPLSIGSGGADGVYDHPIARDANDLPYIPGSSLAGVLRHLWQQQNDQNQLATHMLFGYQDRDHGEASRLEVSSLVMVDSQDRAVEGLLLTQEQQHDRLVVAAKGSRQDPLFRDRVRLTHRGVAKQQGKFDRSIVMAGSRFRGELRFWSDSVRDPNWMLLLQQLIDPQLRLGGAVRAGLGALRLVELDQRSFNLRDERDIAAFQQLPIALDAREGLTDSLASIQAMPVISKKTTQLQFELVPHDFWRIGQGHRSLASGNTQKTAQLLPKQEQRIGWKANRMGRIEGRVEQKLRWALVPGSSIKGALSHRTAFHWNRFSELFVDDMAIDAINQWDKSDHCAGVQALFGYAKERGDDISNRSGEAGRLLFEDAYVEIDETDQMAATHWQMVHNSIDRFAGGVRDRMLFTEELIYNKPITLKITLLPTFYDRVPSIAQRAFATALNDLCEGRLALGGGVTKGHGLFEGRGDEETNQWLQQQLGEGV